MTSARRKGFEPPKSPHFFKIMLSSDALPDGKPGMPKKFLQKHGNDLSSLVFLKVPNGEIWPVQLERSDGRVLLGKGWLKFVDYYSIVPGQLILFRYERNSIFQVVIFDTSSLEIEYPAICPKSKAEYEFPLLKKEETDDISVKISEECWPSQITSEKAKWASGEVSSGLAGEDTNNSHKHLICTCSRSRGREFSSSQKNKPPICSSKNHEGITRNSERRASSVFYGSKGLSPPALKMARKFRSVHPTFVIEMSPSCLRYCSVNVPAGFMRSHISKSPQFVTLKYMNRSWSVKLFKHSERYGSGRFSGGWLMFARETFLRRGDACVFELVEKNRVVFKVSIFRRSDYT